jgi:hypothetical protein
VSNVPAPLAINERSGAVVVLSPDGTTTRVAAEGRWPALAPGGSRVAYSTIMSSEGGQAAVVTRNVAGDGLQAVYQPGPGPLAFIAPSVPHYFLWTPTGQAVSYVAATERGLELAVSTLDGALIQHVVAAAAPLFHCWSTDGLMMAFHAGSRVALFDLATLSITEVHDNGVGFRTPRFLPDGTLLFAAPGGSGIALFARKPTGETRQLAVFDGGLAFEVAGERLLVAVTHQADASLFDSLWQLSVDGSERSLLARGPFAAYWAAPAGERIALLVPRQSGDGTVALHARTLAGEMVSATEALVPSGDLRVATAFFDQYALSHSPWSPGGTTFAIAGRLPGDGVSGSFGDPVGDYVLTWRPERSQPLGHLAPGTFASFARDVSSENATQ